MTKTMQREILIPQPTEQVWRALTDSSALAEWMFPNDFAPRVGHHFTFQVPPNPKVGFDGMVVSCEVLECETGFCMWKGHDLERLFSKRSPGASDE